MIQELYINDVLMDVDEKFNVALLYDSMLFSDIEKLMSNRSTEFSLPKTANNARAIELSHLSDIQDDPSVKILYPRQNHKVDYYQNGVPIVTNALGVMMGVTDRINFVFIFGNMENTRNLEKKMSELPEGDDSFVPWNNSSAVMSYAAANKPGFAYLDYGRGAGLTSSNRQYSHPVVPVNWIIDQIAQSNGLSIDPGVHLKEMFMPLVTKNVSEESARQLGITGTLTSTGTGSYEYLSFSNTTHIDSRLYQSSYVFKGGVNGGYTGPVRIQLNNGLEFLITINKQHADDDFRLQLHGSATGTIYNDLYHNIFGEVVSETATILTKRFVVDMEWDLSNITTWRLRLRSSLESQGTNIFSGLTIPESRIWIKDEEVQFGGDSRFPVIPNLPDMKQVEFLKHMMQLRGLFAYPKGLNQIGLISADELIAKKSTASDWTDKLITDSLIPNVPESIDFKMDHFARTNWFRYSNDDEVNSINTDDSLVVHNETIEREREALKLPFSGSKNTTIGSGDDVRSIASIPLYNTADNKMAKLKPRVLMGRAGDGGRLEVAFESLGFNHILNTYYDGYRRIVEHPRVITVRVKLADLDLSELDLTRPVYFEQFGRHYAILSVQAQADGLCKCKLLEV